MPRKLGCITVALITGAVIWAIADDANTPADKPATACPATAAPEGAELVGTVNFQTGATHVTGSGGIKVSPAGNAATWQAKSTVGIDLTISLVEVDPPKGLSSQKDQPLRMTDFRNNGIKVTLVDTIQKCATTLQSGNRKAYGGNGTVQVFTNH